MRIVFMGTPDFALTALEAIYQAGHEIALVVSQPDKPSGRGYVLTPSPVKKFALEKGIEVITPKTMRDEETANILRSVNADVFVVAAFGKILPQNILEGHDSVEQQGLPLSSQSLPMRHREQLPLQIFRDHRRRELWSYPGSSAPHHTDASWSGR